MRTKTLVVFISKYIGLEEEKMESALIPPLQNVWEPSVVTGEHIHTLATRGLLRPKAEVGWALTTGEEFPMEGTSETVVFLAHIEHGFRVPAGDFFCSILFFYMIELVHLVPNAITIISSFILLCEAYLGIAPHFHLWCYFFELKKIGKTEVMGRQLYAAFVHEVGVYRPRPTRQH
jgi:hypothetical protein